MSRTERAAPLAIFGIDGGDWRSVIRWAAEGRLPTLASILDRGAWARTSGPEHASEHGSGLSMLSGISRADHGHYYFRQLVPGTYDLRVATAKGRAEPFWVRLRGRGRRVAILDPFDCSPVCGLDGLQIANLAVHEAALTAQAAEAEF